VQGASNHSPMFPTVIRKSINQIVDRSSMARGLHRKIAKRWSSGVHAQYIAFNPDQVPLLDNHVAAIHGSLDISLQCLPQAPQEP
jgi:hypothetical protein